MKNILVVMLGLFISFSAAAKDPILDRATDGLFCYQEVSGLKEVQPGIYLDQNSRRLFGEVQETLLLTEDGRLVGVAFDLGVEAPKYKQSHHIYKYLTKKYGAPIDADYAFFWLTDIGLTLAMGAGNQSNSIIFAIYCN